MSNLGETLEAILAAHPLYPAKSLVLHQPADGSLSTIHYVTPDRDPFVDDKEEES
jgi:hypothetical protein